MCRPPIGLLLSALVAFGGAADSLQLNPVADTSIFKQEPGSNFGKYNALPLGTIANAVNPGRLLLRFDLGTLPTNAVITNVSLRLTVVKQSSRSPKPEAIEAHRLLVNWGEGTKGGQLGTAATAGEATWNARLQGQADWGVAGGQAGTDFATAVSTSASLGAPANYTFNTTDSLVADVQSWLQNPAANFGWILLSANESVQASAKRVASREDVASRQPLLTIGYSVPPPQPPAPQFNSFALKSGTLELGFHGEPGYIYTVSFRTAVDAGTWEPLTNIVAKLQPVDALVTDPASQGTRFYQVSITGEVD